MSVRLLCKREVVTVRESEELHAAAQLMRERHVGYLVVVEPADGGEALRPVGVLTDRDIVVEVVARDVDPRSLIVGDVMTPDPVVVREDVSVSAALADMRRIGVRRLPVVGGRGQLIGVLSIDDVLDSLATELLDAAGSMRNEVRVETALRP